MHNFFRVRVVGVCLLAIALGFPLTVFGETLVGKVVKVADGDTVTVLDGNQVQHRVRLTGIDAPESRQAFGKRSREALVALVAGRQVEVEWHKRDRYQRLVGKVIVDGTDANLAQLRAGLAWWYRQYAREQTPADRAIYAAAEAKAQADQRGLWVDRDPVPPWDWRKQ